MEKGRIRIVTGSLLVALQALQFLMLPDGAFSFDTDYILASSLYLLLYWGQGVAGFVLVKLGLKAKRTYEDVSVEVHAFQSKLWAFVGYSVAGLVAGGMVLQLIHIFGEVKINFALYAICLSERFYIAGVILAQIFLIWYWAGYAGRRPSHLMAAVLGFAGGAYSCALVLPLLSVFLFPEARITGNPCFWLGIVCYILLACYLLRENRKPGIIRLLGGVGAGMMLLGFALSGLVLTGRFIRVTDVVLHLGILVYTLVIPLKATTENGGNENG